MSLTVRSMTFDGRRPFWITKVVIRWSLIWVAWRFLMSFEWFFVSLIIFFHMHRNTTSVCVGKTNFDNKRLFLNGHCIRPFQLHSTVFKDFIVHDNLFSGDKHFPIFWFKNMSLNSIALWVFLSPLDKHRSYFMKCRGRSKWRPTKSNLIILIPCYSCELFHRF